MAFFHLRFEKRRQAVRAFNNNPAPQPILLVPPTIALFCKNNRYNGVTNKRNSI